MDPLSRSSKGLKDASNTLKYGRRLNIFKCMMKDLKKVKNILIEKANLVQKNHGKLFCKKICLHI